MEEHSHTTIGRKATFGFMTIIEHETKENLFKRSTELHEKWSRDKLLKFYRSSNQENCSQYSLKGGQRWG